MDYSDTKNSNLDTTFYLDLDQGNLNTSFYTWIWIKASRIQKNTQIWIKVTQIQKITPMQKISNVSTFNSDKKLSTIYSYRTGIAKNVRVMYTSI